MLQSALNTTIGQLVVERPERAALFEEYGIDYCCCAGRPLSEACILGSIDPKEVMKSLIRLDAMTMTTQFDPDWSAAPLARLIQDIVEKHHGYLRDSLPRITFLINKVWDAHARNHPELSDVASVFAALRTLLENHMRREEESLFPLCRSLESLRSGDTGGRRTLAELIDCMESEHSAINHAFEQLATLTHDYGVPADACPTYRVMLSSLVELRSDLAQHIHKEDNILFPRALGLERKLRSRPPEH